VQTLFQILAAAAQQSARRPAVVDGDVVIDYESLKRKVADLATQLQSAGVRQGDSVALLFPNSLEFVTSFFAILSLGAIPVPLNRQYQPLDILRNLSSCAVTLLVTSAEFASLCRLALEQYRETCRLFLVANSELRGALETKASSDFSIEMDAGTPAMYLLSSGSTGVPKRVGRTHANLCFEIDSLIKALEITEYDRILGVAPFSHVNGLTRSMIASVAAGATLYPLAKFDRQLVAETIEQQKISIFIGVPFMFGVLAKTNFRRQPDFSSLRLCVSASAPLPSKLNHEFHQKFGIYVRQLYGSTETGTISVNLSPDIEESLDSVGKPINGVQVEIFNQAGESTQPNEVGEIAVKSQAAIKSYDGCEELNRETFKNDYFLTGDLGRRDKQGLLYLAGRKKLFINKAGYKINPQEIEDWLRTYSKVEQAVVVGLPTAFGDEKVKAVIVVNDSCSEDELIEHCRGKIADFKIPSLIEFRDEIPMTPTGKIRRDMLL
jgi:long-chain acyl-CoA synthetase